MQGVNHGKVVVIKCNCFAVFFTEISSFLNYIAEQQQTNDPVHYLTVCSPNHLHEEHIIVVDQRTTMSFSLALRPCPIDVGRCATSEPIPTVQVVFHLPSLPCTQYLGGDRWHVLGVRQDAPGVLWVLVEKRRTSGL